MFDKFLKQFY